MIKTLATTNTRGICDAAERMAEDLRAQLGGIAVRHAVTRGGWEKRVVGASERVLGVVRVTLGDPYTTVEVAHKRPSLARRVFNRLTMPKLTH